MLVTERQARPLSYRIKCPSCRAYTRVPDGGAGGMPTTHAIVQLQDTLASLNEIFVLFLQVFGNFSIQSL